MSYQVIKMDMFLAPQDAYLLGSVNCKGVWGGGVAYFMKEKYPLNFQLYHEHCINTPDNFLIGTAQITDTTDGSIKPRRIINLFTSKAFGLYKDQPSKILQNTAYALRDLFCKFGAYDEYSKDFKEIKIYSNKFNSGLFNVPWEDTEKVLLDELNIFKDDLNITWTVCDWN